MWNGSFVKMAFKALLIAVLVSYSVAQDFGIPDTSVQASSATLIFNGETAVVNPGQRIPLDCGVQGKYRSCIWDKEGENAHTFQVEDIHEGVFRGMSRPDTTKGNECGIIIDSVAQKDNGLWTCKVFVFAKTLTGTKRIVVTVKPQPPTININESPLVIAENQEMEIGCTVPAARPQARIRWFVGTEDVTARSRGENKPVDEMGTYRTESVLNYRFHHTDDRKILKCIVEHQTLEEPEYAEVPLDVRYKPYPISSTEIYGIPLDNEYEIKYNFTANPLPEMLWYVQNEEIPVPGENGRYMANIKNLMDNIYMATLRIRDFNPDDLGVSYRLNAKNDLGERNFDISLSTGPAPPDGGFGSSEIISTPENKDSQDSIGSGTLTAIVIIILLILIILFIIGVMRYRQMYCFGSKDKIKDHLKESGETLKEEHDTESAPREPEAQKKTTSWFKNIRAIVPVRRKGQKEPRPDQLEAGEHNEGKSDDEEVGEGETGGNTNPEIVYAELELGKSDSNVGKINNSEKSEYAEIVGTVPDNKSQEKKE